MNYILIIVMLLCATFLIVTSEAMDGNFIAGLHILAFALLIAGFTDKRK